VLAAVERPGEAAAVGRHLKSEARIGDDVDPGCGRGLPGRENRHVFAALRVETSESVEVFEIAARCPTRRRLGPGNASRRQCDGHDGLRVRSSWSEILPRRATSTTRATAESKLRLCAEMRSVRSNEHRAARAMGRGGRPRLGHPRLGFQGVLQVLDVGGSPIIEDHQINRETLHLPVFMCLKQMAGDGYVLDCVDSQQHDGNVAGNSLGPQSAGGPLPSRIVVEGGRIEASA